MQILFLSRWFPYPPNNGAKLRAYNLIKGLATQHEIVLISFIDQPTIDLTTSPLKTICKDIRIVPQKTFRPTSRRSLLGFFSRAPRSVSDTYSPEMRSFIENAICSEKFDLIIASELGTAVYSQFFNNLPAIFEDIELGVFFDQFNMAGSPWHRFRYGLTWNKHRQFIGSLLQQFRACTVVSEQERQLVLKVSPAYQDIELIPNCINLPDYEVNREKPNPSTLIFTGSFSYFANYDAMQWFLGEVYPLIENVIPDVSITITGDHGNKTLPDLKNITRTGIVGDVRPLIASSWISLAPIRIGGGTRLKILEAMALRTPVVSTSKGAEGLDVIPNRHLLIADSPNDFAQAVIQLLTQSGLREQITQAAYELVSEKYNWERVMPRFLSLTEKTAHEVPGSFG